MTEILRPPRKLSSTDERIAAATKELGLAWGEERLADYLKGLAAWAGPLAEAKASHEGHMRIRIHQGRWRRRGLQRIAGSHRGQHQLGGGRGPFSERESLFIWTGAAPGA